MASKRETKDLNLDAGIVITVIFIVAALFIGVWLESFFIGIVIAICGLYYGLKTSTLDTLSPKRTLPPIDYPEDGTGDRTLTGTEYICKIAGITHHASSSDIGGFVGVVCSDPTNPHDSKAVGIYSETGKLLGYIPKDELKEFREWTSRDPLPCIGYIRKGDSTDLYGKIKIIDGDRNITAIHMIKYAIWMIENFGAEYVPDRFFAGVHYKNMTTEEWLDYLDEELDNRKTLKKELDKQARKRNKA